MQVKIFRSYDERALEEEMNDFLGDYYTSRILKIDYRVLLGHYDDLNDREHFLFTAIVHYIDDDEEFEEGEEVVDKDQRVGYAMSRPL
jgi:hypothetical protein